MWTTLQYPPDFRYAESKWLLAQLAAARIAGLARSHRRVVQAGGCVGFWPLALASGFETVVTCEPEPMNLRALRANTAAVPTIHVEPVALGATIGSVGLTRPTPGAGLWRVSGAGPIPQRPLDTLLEAGPVDAIVLDVEGAEVDVWRGAASLIAAHRPLLWFEDRDHSEPGRAWLAAHGYQPPQAAPGLGRDAYSQPQEWR
jgi:FkbM family methyltransferase